jgi:2-polyprenyl-6-methoxyphenol hydroxylase-like FAD-dependent oxidoreductase
MSPIGGVGINYAVQDAVAAANILVPAFKNGVPDIDTLNKIQARREEPTRKMQKLQVFIQDRVLSPALNRGRARLPWPILALKYFPYLRRFPAKIIGIGFRPEHVVPALIKEPRAP